MPQHRARPVLQSSSQPKGAVVGVPLFLVPQLQRSKATVAESGASGAPSALIEYKPQGRDTETSAIRLYDNAASHQAADELGAYGYSWQGDIFLGARLGTSGRPAREKVVQHELTHAKQAHSTSPAASEEALEQEAHSSLVSEPTLAADPNQVLGFWWVIPAAVGLYVLLRPSVANAPGPDDPVYESPSEAQIVGEALMLFAVPGGVAGALGRAGYGVIGSFALSGAASAVGYRGVQDIGAGQFSGIEAYVVDAGTGAVIGAVIGGVFRPFINTAGAAARPNPSLIHLTDTAGQSGITSSGVLRGSQGIYAVPSSVANEGTALRVLRTLVPRARTQAFVNVHPNATGMFSRPLPIGPVSTYQRLMGVYRAPAGSINMLTGEFTASGNSLANITGQFWPYGVDGLIWASGAYIGSQLSPQQEGAEDRGITGWFGSVASPIQNTIRSQSPLPESQRSDGPFIFADPGEVGNLPAFLTASTSISAEQNVCTSEPVEPLMCEAPIASGMEPAPSLPAVIFVTPLRQEVPL